MESKLKKKDREAICAALGICMRTYYNAVNPSTMNPDSLTHIRVLKMIKERKAHLEQMEHEFQSRARQLMAREVRL